jgi:hypothetical protein
MHLSVRCAGSGNKDFDELMKIVKERRQKEQASKAPEAPKSE